MPVRNRLKELLIEKMSRENRIISETEVAKATAMTRQNVNKWMHNQIKMFNGDTVDALCKFLDCQVGDLLVRVDGPEH